jgi:predicted CopG family antitoxin
MPEEGFRTITVSDKLYDTLQKIAEKEHRSIAKTLENLLEERTGVASS